MSSEVATRRRRLALRLAAGALTWSLGLLITALALPLYDGQTTSDANGLTLSTATYVQRFGVATLIPLALPALASLLALMAITRPGRARRRAAEALIALTALAGLVFVLSGGVLLLPVAALAAAGLRLVRPPRAPVADGRGRERRGRSDRPASARGEGA